jgi:hypothetical protein
MALPMPLAAPVTAILRLVWFISNSSRQFFGYPESVDAEVSSFLQPPAKASNQHSREPGVSANICG